MADTAVEAARDATFEAGLAHTPNCSIADGCAYECSYSDTAAEAFETAAYNEGRAEVETLRKALRALVTVAYSNGREACGHGNSAPYPTHAIWCDDCWGDARALLTEEG